MTFVLKKSDTGWLFFFNIIVFTHVGTYFILDEIIKSMDEIILTLFVIYLWLVAVFCNYFTPKLRRKKGKRKSYVNLQLLSFLKSLQYNSIDIAFFMLRDLGFFIILSTSDVEPNIRCVTRQFLTKEFID